MLSKEFFPAFVAMCERIGADPVSLLSVAASESGCQPTAYNEGGHAAGLWQLTRVAAPGVGWNPNDMRGFSRLTDVEQLVYWERYFARHRGRLTSAVAAYLADYLPALLDLAGNPDALLCSKDGRTHASQSFPRVQVISWYTGNRGFDRGNTGEIHVRDLTAAIRRSTLSLGGVWADAVANIQRVQSMTPGAEPSATPVDVDVTGGLGPPLFIAPDPEESA